MFRVVIKIQQVCIKIQDKLDVHIAIKKNDTQFYLPYFGALMNEQAHIPYFSQFYIMSNNANFSVEVILFKKNIRKMAGSCFVNLLLYEINTLHRIESFLETSTTHKSKIVMDIQYMHCTKQIDGRQIYLPQTISSLQSSSYIQSYVRSIIRQNQQLNQELLRLTQVNQSIFKTKNQLEVIFRQKQQQLKSDIKNIRDKIKQLQNLQINLVVKSQKIIDEVKAYGSSQLNTKLLALLNTQQDQHFQLNDFQKMDIENDKIQRQF